MSKGKEERKKIVIDRKKEMRSKDISKMIDEGGLGNREYYDIEKQGEPEDKRDIYKDED